MSKEYIANVENTFFSQRLLLKITKLMLTQSIATVTFRISLGKFEINPLAPGVH